MRSCFDRNIQKKEETGTKVLASQFSLDYRARRSGWVSSTTLISSAFTALLNCAEVKTTKSNSNELPISVSLSLFSRYYSLNSLMNFEVPLVSYWPDSLKVFIRRLLFIPKKILVRQLDAVAVWFLHSLFKLRKNLISFAGVELRTKVLFHSHPLL